ncbi:alpha-hydroxyketone-type quorum-sensing autoinducer synthase [Photobacterium sp. Ph6]|uniref:alpha-hydroxyketone-type quorum-sensing autoinducer synthase n=1 Tax=unclassified Photobacterium TaxID=2628852 RepID=UPI0031F74EEE
MYSRKNKKHLVLGKIPSDTSITLQSNDYLAITGHEYIQLQHLKAITDHKHEVVMSAVFQHQTESGTTFEEQLAALTGFEKCVLSQSGWAANVGLIQTLIPQGTPIYIDFFAHMSLWDGAKRAEGNIQTFLHNNMRHLEKQIKREGPGLIMVDSVYSTIGTVAPLHDLVEIANRYGCALLVDESHSLGTHGKNGAGLVAELGLTDQVDFLTASLAKAFAYRAGAILCSKAVAKSFPFTAFPAIFSSALLNHELEILKATLDVIKDADDKRNQLFVQSEKLRNGLVNLGYKIKSQSQIIALESGNDEDTEVIRDYLESRDVFGSVFCSPATPKNKNVIRFSLNSDVSDEQISTLLAVCRDMREELSLK